MRIKELDAFRGLAALSVVLYHYTIIYSENFDVKSPFYFKHGWLGVPFFFILSGFVITLTIEKCTSSFQFLKKRFIRLYPTFWICLLFTLTTIWITNSQLIHPRFNKPTIDILFNFTMFHSLLKYQHVDGAYWSLLPELLFYLLIAFIFFIKKINNILIYNSVILITCFIHYFFPIPIIGRLLDLQYILLFMIGICFYKIYTRKDKAPLFLHLLIISNLILGIFLYAIEVPNINTLIIYISFPLIVVFFYFFVYFKFYFFGKSRILLFLGFISYPLYLIHQSIGYIFMLFFDQFMPRYLSIIFTIFAAIILSSIVTYYLEPLLRKPIKKLIFKSKNQ